MDNPYLGRVNQQLIFARHQLQLKTEGSETTTLNANERMRNQGILHAGLWHLRWAYRAYLAEIGANYKLIKPELPNTASELSQALEAINKHPGEAQELERLESEGFVRDILLALRNIEQIESGLIPPAPSEAESQGLLALKDITDTKEAISLDFDMLSKWIRSFKELVDRHREHMIEY